LKKPTVGIKKSRIISTPPELAIISQLPASVNAPHIKGKYGKKTIPQKVVQMCPLRGIIHYITGF
jgi:hypothetical protein